MTDQELMQQALDAMLNFPNDISDEMFESIKSLRARLAQPEPDDGYCQACEGNHCTAKNGCIALDNPRAQPEPEELGEVIPADEEQLKRIAKLVEPEPEPVAWWHDMGDVVDLNVSGRGTPLYFAPPQREWQGLTDEEMFSLWVKCPAETDFARAIEAKLKEKNT